MRERLFWNKQGLVGLWWGVLAGPIAWALEEPINYSLVKHACAEGHRTSLFVVTTLAALMCISGFWTAWRLHAQLPANAELAGAGVFDRAFFMARVGMVLSAFVLLLVLASLVPQFVLSPCE